MAWNLKLRRATPTVDLGTTDLDAATDRSVIYIQRANADATPERHYPFMEACIVEPLPYSPTSPDRIIQRLTTWQTLRVAHRARFNGVWGDWKEVG